jgi:hypothetical protein
MEAVAATLCSLDEQLSLLAALLTTLLITAIVAFAVAAAFGCKQWQEKRERIYLGSLESPAEESGRERGEMILPVSSTSGHAVKSDILYFSRELVKYCTSITTTMPVQTESVDDEGELVVS